MDITGTKLLSNNIFLYPCFVLLICTFISFLTISVHCLPPVSCPFPFSGFCNHVAEHLKEMKKKIWGNVIGQNCKTIYCLSGDSGFNFSPKIILVLSRLTVWNSWIFFSFQSIILFSIFRNILHFRNSWVFVK